MFGFIKNMIGGGQDENQNPSDLSNNNDHTDSRDYYWENKKLTEFLLANFPTLSQKRFLRYKLDEHKELKEIDISIYFADNDKYLVSENNLKKVAFSEFTHLPKEDLNVEDILMRVEILEKYNKTIDGILQKSATKHYDKFRKKRGYSCYIYFFIEEGIMNLDYFHTTSEKCLENVQQTRKDLVVMQNDLVKKSLRINRLIKQKTKKQVCFILGDNIFILESC